MAGQPEYDCVISGAGPTGLTLALELARRGKSVRIFDRSVGPRPLDQSRALGILPATLAALEPSGVTSRLLTSGLKIEHARVLVNGVHKFTIPLERAEGTYPFILSLEQGHTERILIEALQQCGVFVEWESPVVGIDQTGALPALLVDIDRRREAVTGNMVAGCDGVRSLVRQKLGIAFDGDKLETQFSLADVELNESFPNDALLADLRDKGVLAQIPLPNGKVRLIAAEPSVQSRADISNRIKSVGWTSDFSIAFHHANVLSKDGYFLAGDAAHVHSPVGGRGMNTGIGDAAWLANLYCEHRLEDYQKLRLPVAKSVIRQTRNLTNFATNSSRFRSFVMGRLVPQLFRFAYVQKRAAQQLLAYDMLFPDWTDRDRH